MIGWAIIRQFLLGKGGTFLIYLMVALAAVLVMVIVFDTGVRRGEKAAEARLLPRIEELVSRKAECDTRATQLESSLAKQNEAILRLEERAKEREIQVKQAVAKAKREAQSYEENARWFKEVRSRVSSEGDSCSEGLKLVRQRFSQ
jgi:hypothetical protein